jgi:DnaJ-class molecular chaperone
MISLEKFKLDAINYYSVLGVSETATAEEIKKVYKDLAKKNHPDLNGGSKESETRFKEINAAYDILGDQSKREQYDNQRKYGQQGHSFSFHQHHFGDLNDILNHMYNINQRQQAPTKNRDIHVRLSINLEDAYYGKSVPIQINNSTAPIQVDIPAGISTGQTIKFAGYGDKSNTALLPGDLIVQIYVADNDEFKRSGEKLLKILDLSAFDALVGTEVEIQCIDKSKIKLKIPPATQHGTHLNVSKKGMPFLNDSKNFGDMIIGINLTVPTLSEKVRNAIKAAYEENK